MTFDLLDLLLIGGSFHCILFFTLHCLLQFLKYLFLRDEVHDVSDVFGAQCNVLLGNQLNNLMARKIVKKLLWLTEGVGVLTIAQVKQSIFVL